MIMFLKTTFVQSFIHAKSDAWGYLVKIVVDTCNIISSPVTWADDKKSFLMCSNKQSSFPLSFMKVEGSSCFALSFKSKTLAKATLLQHCLQQKQQMKQECQLAAMLKQTRKNILISQGLMIIIVKEFEPSDIIIYQFKRI